MTTSQTIVRAAFLADSHGLGPHWVYDQDKLAQLYPEGVKSLDVPRSQYHPNRSSGQFTHFGDQMLILLKSLVASSGWVPTAFRQSWSDAMRSYDGYLDGATTETLANLDAGKSNPASASSDLSGASRLFPLLLLDLPQDELISAARAQTALTHGDPAVIDAAEFFVRATLLLRNGTDLDNALQSAASANYSSLPATKYLQSAQTSASSPPNEAAKKLGLACNLADAFPTTLLFALRWHHAGADSSPDGFLNALSENALAGGDTSARAMPLAALLAAAGAALPEQLWNRVQAAATIDTLLAS